jgi:lipoprotein NlpI
MKVNKYFILFVLIVFISSCIKLKYPDVLVHQNKYDNELNFYTKEIENGKNYYQQRGDIYFKMNLLRLAIKDYSQALKINPVDFNLYKKRGFVFYIMGTHYASIVDYSRAIEINPFNSSIYRYRAFDYIYSAKESERYAKETIIQAEMDFRRCIEVSKINVQSTENEYLSYIDLFLLYKIYNQNKVYNLSDYIQDIDLKKWPYILMSLFLNKTTPNKVIKETKNNVKLSQIAHYYIGQYFLLDGNPKEAKELFKKVIDSKIISIYYKLAQIELETLTNKSKT